MSTAASADHSDQKISHCANCHSEILGPHCYACGQPVKGMVRHFSSVIGDFFDTLLAFDSRTWKTVPSLFLRPGFLTAEYFSGRRVRYVSPVRLFIFLCITSFFVTQLNSDWAINFGNNEAVAVDVESAGKGYDDAVEKIRKVKEEHTGNSVLAATLEEIEHDLVNEQVDFKKDLNALNDNLRGINGEPNDSDNITKEEITSGLNDTITELDEEFLQFKWLPHSVEDWLNKKVDNAHKNVERVMEDPNRFKKAFLGALPSTLIIMLPIFAMMLWVLYIFKHRLYMEHLIVALHSHAFICLSILIANLFYSVSEQLGGYAAVSSIFDGLLVLLVLWVPIYLFWMQKRVYQQGWFRTLCKYSFLGLAYLSLLTVGAALTVFWSLAEL
ncbi:DUF3667 domain-containing protein [Microbulbifer sp. OS29]|uniref:DUF3667 domain-containing protein n=1 Tax=Microbulbifer okhotskensis TaxID=2926617 RepID=A0A9X2J6J5_9GAMM|nr:DUF3667 domain-containing protein [Microbulbifer okhotskensis]MCO1334680.1 DUF3667 domain-containing protein [Microbulbifer okhotskensis]